MLVIQTAGREVLLTASKLEKMAVESRVTQEEIKKEPEKPIDREKVIERGPCIVYSSARGSCSEKGFPCAVTSLIQ